MSQESKKDIQQLVGNTLRTGVWLSFAITLSGLLLFLFQNSTQIFSTGILPAEPVRFSLKEMARGLIHGDALSIVTLGVLMMLITPVLRVVFALYGYWLERNKLYMFISIVVLSIIAGSLLIGATH